MGFLKRGRSDAVADGELSDLRGRRAKLADRLAAADAKLVELSDARRKALLESNIDDDAPISGDLATARDARDALVDAIQALDAKISEVDARVVSERDRQLRAAEVERRRQQVELCRAGMRDFSAITDRMVGTLLPMMAASPMVGPAADQMTLIGRGVAEIIENALADVAYYIQGVATGNQPIRSEAPPAPPAAKPLPPIERRSVFMLVPGKWFERGEVKTAGAGIAIALPVDVAQSAIEHRHAIDTSHFDVVAKWREQIPPDYSFWPADRCIDLTMPAPVPMPKPPGERLVEPVTHSSIDEITRRPAMTGTATVAMPAR